MKASEFNYVNYVLNLLKKSNWIIFWIGIVPYLSNLWYAYFAGDQIADDDLDVKDPYVFEEGRCHCCGEDIETAHMVSME